MKQSLMLHGNCIVLKKDHKTFLSGQASYSCIILNGGCVVLFSHFYVSDMATREVPAEGYPCY